MIVPRSLVRISAILLVIATTLGSVPLQFGFWKQATQQGSVIPPSLYVGLVHAWMMNEGTGSTVPDRIGGKDLTIHGGTWATVSGQVGITLVGASSQYLDTAAWTAGTNDGATVVIWIYATSALTSQMFFIKEPVSGPGIAIQQGAALQLITTGGNLNAATKVPTNQWVQVTGGVRNATGNGDIYFNGVESGGSQVGGYTADVSTICNIGRYSGLGGGWYVTATVGPCYFYNRILTTNEISQLLTVKYLY